MKSIQVKLVVEGERAVFTKLNEGLGSPMIEASHGFIRVMSKLVVVDVAALLFSLLVKVKVYTFVPSSNVLSMTPKTDDAGLSVKMEDIEPPPFKLVPGKAAPFTVTVLVALYPQAGVYVKVG